MKWLRRFAFAALASVLLAFCSGGTGSDGSFIHTGNIMPTGYRCTYIGLAPNGEYQWRCEPL